MSKAKLIWTIAKLEEIEKKQTKLDMSLKIKNTILAYKRQLAQKPKDNFNRLKLVA
jgi:hypothetical protein